MGHIENLFRDKYRHFEMCIGMEMTAGKVGRWRRACRSTQAQSKQLEAMYDEWLQYKFQARAREKEIFVKKQCLMKGLNSMAVSRPYHFPAVRLRGLPFNCCDVDILKFFLGFIVVDILLVHSGGRRLTGEAYVVFSTPIQVSYARQKHGQSIRHRYIEVFNCGKTDYYRAIAAETRAHTTEFDYLEYSGVLKLRGLPFTATKKDIIQFFEGFKLIDDDVQILLSAGGRTSGEAFVTFASCFESKAAMGKDKMMLGDRYIELFPIPRADGEKPLSCKRFEYSDH